MKRVTLKGTSDQIQAARKLIEEKVSEDADLEKKIQMTSETRLPRLKHKQPLFLTSEAFGADDDASSSNVDGRQTQEHLYPTSEDNLMEVFVSAISNPGCFYVQKIGTKSVELDRLGEEMTDFYNNSENREAHVLTEVRWINQGSEYPWTN